MIAVILKRFESPDETRRMVKGKFEVVRLGGLTVGRATYEPGRRWSVHVGPGIGQTRCALEHVGLVLSGAATAAFDDGRVVELRAGDFFNSDRTGRMQLWRMKADGRPRSNSPTKRTTIGSHTPRRTAARWCSSRSRRT
jgi:hypothetical protein